MDKIVVNRGMKTQLAKELKTSRKSVVDALEGRMDTPKHLAIRKRAQELIDEYYSKVDSYKN